MQTIVGLFDKYDNADRAIRELRRRGIAREHLSIMAHESVAREHLRREPLDTTPIVAEGAAAGATGGALLGGLGGLLAGVSAMLIPGVGPVYAAGSLLTALVTTAGGAGLGAMGGGLLGAIMGWGVPKSQAHAYAEGTRRGGILVAARVPDEAASEVNRVLRNADALDIDAYQPQLRDSGWTHFEETSDLHAVQQ